MVHENSLNNLKPIKLSHEEAVKNGRKGGIASGQARKEKRIFKEAILERMGEDDFNEIIDRLISRAKWDNRSLIILRDTLGQKPETKVYHEEVDPAIIAEIEAAVLAYGNEEGGSNGSISDNKPKGRDR